MDGSKVWFAVIAVALALGLLVSPGFLVASDHDDGETDTKGRNMNLTDVYAFLEKDQDNGASPHDLILIMNTNPRSVARQQYFFSTNAHYKFKVSRVENNSNTPTGAPDVILRFEFGPPDSAAQQAVTLTVIRDGASTTVAAGTTTPLLDTRPSVARVPVDGSSLSVFAGLREDPFFFDVEQFFRVRAGLLGKGAAVGFRPVGSAPGSAVDFTAGYNVNAIVVRIPISVLGGSTSKTIFDVWATVAVPGASCPNPDPDDGFCQVERLARPAINEGLILTNAFLNALNSVGPDFETAALAGTQPQASIAAPILAEAVSTLKALGNDQTRINQLVSAFLPDVMRIDTTQPSGYAAGFTGLNGPATLTRGRMITDDVIDATLFVLTNGGVTSDNVSYAGPNANGSQHKPLLPKFPYLADPN